MYMLNSNILKLCAKDESKLLPVVRLLDIDIINPRRACAARVTVVVLSVCLSVCVCVCRRLFWHYSYEIELNNKAQ